MKTAQKQQDEFIARCRRAGLSVTHQRLAIFEAVMANGDVHRTWADFDDRAWDVIAPESLSCR